MKSKTTTTTTTKLISKNNSGKTIKNNFFICCRPPPTPLVVINMKDAGPVPAVQSFNDGTGKPVPTYDAVVEEKQGGEFPDVLSSEASLSEGDHDCGFKKEVLDAKRKKKGGGKKLLRVLKKALFETSLAKKIGRKKLKQKLHRPQGKSIAEPLKSEDEESYYDKNGRAVSTASSSLRSSSTVTSSSVSSSNSRILTYRNAMFPINTYDKNVQKQDNSIVLEHGKRCYFGPNTGLCFLLISLLVLVFWGKLCAIVCTSTWLFFVPRWTLGDISGNFANDPSKHEWEDHKKKIIMEGFLERNTAEINNHLTF